MIIRTHIVRQKQPDKVSENINQNPPKKEKASKKQKKNRSNDDIIITDPILPIEEPTEFGEDN